MFAGRWLMTADIVSGQSDWADVVWLIAVIFAVLAAARPATARDGSSGYPWSQTLGWGAVALLALGLLLL